MRRITVFDRSIHFSRRPETNTGITIALSMSFFVVVGGDMNVVVVVVVLLASRKLPDDFVYRK